MRALLLLVLCAAAGYGVFQVLGDDQALLQVPGESPDIDAYVEPGDTAETPREDPNDRLLETAPGIPPVGVMGVDEEPRALLDWGEWREYRLPPREDNRVLTGEDFLKASKGRLPIRFASAKLLEDFRKLEYRAGQRVATHDEVPLGEIVTLIGAGQLHFEEREAYLFIGQPPEEE